MFTHLNCQNEPKFIIFKISLSPIYLLKHNEYLKKKKKPETQNKRWKNYEIIKTKKKKQNRVE